MIRTNNEVQLVENGEMREKLIGRVEVLDKVKKLFLIPGLEMMTSRQIADYYEVEHNTLKLCYQHNQAEIDSDGVLSKKLSEWKELFEHSVHDVPSVQTQTGIQFKLSNDVTIVIPNAGIRCFTKRAVLRFGMLLRDSKVAKEVRTQLLNVFEHSTIEQKVAEIGNEEKLLLELGKSYVSRDFDAFALANQNYIDYQN